MKKLFKVGILLTIAILLVFSGCAGSGSDEAAKIYPIKGFTPAERDATPVEDGKTVEMNIFTTNDEHGWIFDWDFGQAAPRQSRGEPRPSGLARVSTLYKKLSAESPNSMLISAGDSIQGTILAYYYNFLKPGQVNPISAIYEQMGYEAWAIGNHEVEQGSDVLLKVANEMAARDIPVLSANAVYEGTEDPYYQPYMIKEVDGVRVGILGMTTPGIPMWLADDTHPGYEFLSMVETAEKWVPILRNKEKVDVLLGLFHSGMNEEYDIAKAKAAGVPAPNASSMVARAIGGGAEGFDAIVTGHSHKVIDDTQNTEYPDTDSNVVNGVKFIQAKNWGERLGQITIQVEGKDGSWTVQDVAAATYTMDNVEEDPEILTAMEDYIEGAKEYAEAPVAQAEDTISGERSFVEDTAVVDLIHETQFWATDADISIAASFGSSTEIPKGDITVGNIAGIYIYENFLNAIELTGQQVKDYLEYSAKYYNTITEETVDTKPLINPEVRGYNYDMAAGFQYDIDITKPAGERIVNMKNMDGTPFDLEKTYTVALNSYRYNGGGGHLQAVGAVENNVTTAKTVYFSDKAMRDLMIEFLKKEGSWSSSDKDDNWELVPEDLADQAIENQLATGADAR